MKKVRLGLQISALSMLLSSGFGSAWAAEESTSGGPIILKEAHLPVPTKMQEVKPDPNATWTGIQRNFSQRQQRNPIDTPRNSVKLQRKTRLEPVWRRLEKMTPAERDNALIDIELPTGVSQDALAQAEKVKNTWNSGDYQKALQLFRALSGFVDIYEVAVGISWKTPIETSSNISNWGTDVMVGNRGGIINAELDFDEVTGNLFAAVVFVDSTNERWAVNISMDGGMTWQETFNYNSGGPNINDVSATVSGTHFWVSYTNPGSQTTGRLRRHLTSDGSSDGTYFFQDIFDQGSEITDLELSSNQDASQNRIYYSAILTNGTLALFWDDTTGMSFTEVTTGITNAERGMDSHWNQNYSSLHTWFSWINTADEVHIAGWSGGTFTDFTSGSVGNLSRFSSLGSWGDTVLCAYDYRSGSGSYMVRYLISYNGGTNWFFGFIGDTTYSYSGAPHVTGRMGGGFHVVYEIEAGMFDPVVYIWRPYATPSWSTPEWISENDVYTGDYKQRIEWLPGGYYGVVYIEDAIVFGVGNCYFDRIDWVGVEEKLPAQTPKEFNLFQPRPNPFHNNTIISLLLPRSLDTDLSVYDLTGRRVATLTDGRLEAGRYSFTWDGRDSSGREVSSGVYFYRLTAGDYTSTKKLVLLR
ncbi:T9SS type A sorting domain-containing protein [candidate division TA06 bacterium]|nr:T9SS type A sorting domain-containing protein [candidate division TA06 bacterium]